jgi:polar amino acid transport system substrate-binding protein
MEIAAEAPISPLSSMRKMMETQEARMGWQIGGRTRLSIIAVVAGTMTLIAGNLAQAAECSANNSRLATILKRGKLLAGVRYDYPPNGYVDSAGKNMGFGPDIAREFAKHLGVSLEMIQTKADTRIPMIQTGLIDLDIGPTTPEKARNEVVDFSYTYVWDQSVIVVRAGMSKNPADYYTDTKVVVGDLQGGNFAALWRGQAPNATIKLYQENPDLMVALTQGKVDVGLLSEYTAHSLIESLGERAKGLEIGGAFSSDPQAIIVPQNDSKWRNWVNWALQRLWAEGTFQKLYKDAYKIDPPFHLWENGQLQPHVEKIARDCDPW